MSEFHPLASSSPLQSEYTISSNELTSMDDVSLNSSSPQISSKSSLLRGSSSSGGGGSSSVSVSSKFSRKSLSLKRSELAVPLAPSSSYDYEDRDGRPSTAVPTSSLPSSPISSNNKSSPSKSYISEDDPFHLFRTDLISKLSQVNSQLNNYLTLISTTDTAVNIHAIRDSKKQLKHTIKTSESTLRDLETTIRVVDKSRYKFPHITDVELNERKNFVEKTKDTLVDTKLRMQSDDVKRKILEDERALSVRRGGVGNGGGGSGNTSNNTNNYYRDDLHNNSRNNINSNHTHDHDDPLRAETLSMMKQQDETLDDLDLAVTRVSYIADTIHEELESQNIMLNNLGEDLSNAEEQMGVVMGKLGKLLKTKSKCQIGLILILSAIVLVLFFLVLYT
jgi:syntaxin 6